VNTIGSAALVDTVETVGRADTGPNVILALFDDLPDDVRVRHMYTGHADHVDLAGSVEIRELGRGANFAGEIEMRGTRHANPGQRPLPNPPIAPQWFFPKSYEFAELRNPRH
jgi:hypothetical protein